MTGNWFATFALLAWPVVALWLYRTKPVNRATLWTILGAHLLLPAGTFIKLEMIPQLDKTTVPNLAALLGCIFILRRRIRFSNGFGIVELILLALLISPFITSLLNSDPRIVGERLIPGVGLYDAGSALMLQVLILIPFFIGRHILREAADTAEILRILAAAGLIYSLPMLFEVRMSPQLHTWIYGYFPHSFAQQARDGGFRPVVFLGHGLLVAFFSMTSVVAAAALWRVRQPVIRLPAGAVTVYLGIVLVLCKTLGALLYAALLVPLVRLTHPKMQIRIAAILAALVLLYPTLRMMDLVPARAMVELARSVSDNRAESLNTRLTQEDRLVRHASTRFYFGWGRWGRSRVYDEWTGKDVSITDGRWIIILGQFGLVGFLAEFGLLALTVFRAASALRFVRSAKDGVFLSALALIVAINLVDLLPNSSLSPWTWLLAGGLLGRAEALRAEAQNSAREWAARANSIGQKQPV